MKEYKILMYVVVMVTGGGTWIMSIISVVLAYCFVFWMNQMLYTPDVDSMFNTRSKVPVTVSFCSSADSKYHNVVCYMLFSIHSLKNYLLDLKIAIIWICTEIPIVIRILISEVYFLRVLGTNIKKKYFENQSNI